VSKTLHICLQHRQQRDERGLKPPNPSFNAQLECRKLLREKNPMELPGGEFCGNFPGMSKGFSGEMNFNGCPGE